MEDFQGKYNGEQIEQLLDKANDIDLSKYALKTDNAPTATKLQAARTIALSGAVTGSVSSDFGSNVTISTTLANFDASKIASGTISIDRLPKAALERLIVVADDTARFKLTTATAQVGDTVKVTATNKMYLVKDDSKLNTEAGYEPYTAGSASSVPWSGVTGKPNTFAPPTSSATVLGGIKVGYTTSGKNYKVQVDSSGNAFVNVPWTDTNTTYSNMGAATSSATGKAGLVPAPAAGAQGKYLRGDGTWQTPPNTTYSNMGGATSSATGTSGLVPAPAAGKQASFLRGDGTWVVPTNTTYAKASTSTLGLVMIGYAENGKNYPVELDGSGKMFVNVPWTDTNTTYSVVGANGTTGLVKNGSTVTSASGYTACPIISGVPYYKDTNTTYKVVSSSSDGLMPKAAFSTLNSSSLLIGNSVMVAPPSTGGGYPTYSFGFSYVNIINGSTGELDLMTCGVPGQMRVFGTAVNGLGLIPTDLYNTIRRCIGVNTVTTLANLPISKRSITATLSAATTLSVQSGMQIGEELMIRCVPSAAFTQAIPNSGAYVSMSGTSITTTANKPFEINIWCYASGKYSIAVKEQD